MKKQKKLGVIKKPGEYNKEVIEILLSIIINDNHLSLPIYIHGISNEEQSKAFGNLYPLQYVWNEYKTNAGHIGFIFSVNGSVVGSMLETIVPGTNPNFTAIRDEVISVLGYTGKESLSNLVEKTLLPPSQLLKSFEYKNLINLNFNQ